MISFNFKCRHSLKNGANLGFMFWCNTWVNVYTGKSWLANNFVFTLISFLAHSSLGFHLMQPPPSHDLRAQTQGICQVQERSVHLRQLLFLCSFQASVCMVKPEDAQNLAGSTELFIRQQKLTASVAKVLLKSIRTCKM